MIWKLYEGREDDFQVSAFRYIRLRTDMVFHVGNERKGNKAHFSKIKRQGVVAGVSDLIVMEPRGVYHGAVIELKAGAGRPSKPQIDFLLSANKNGYMTMLTWSLDELMHYVDMYFKLKEGGSIASGDDYYCRSDGKILEYTGGGLRVKKESLKT